MMNGWMKLGGIVAAASFGVLSAGCGGDDDNSQGNVQDQTAGTIVHVKADITVNATNKSRVDQIRLTVGSLIEGLPDFAAGASPGIEEIEVLPGTTVKLVSPTGAEQTLGITADTTKRAVSLTTGFDVASTGANKIVITGPSGAVKLSNIGTITTSTVIGRIEVTFSKLATSMNGNVLVIPNVAGVAIPTSVSTLRNGATFRGLPVGTTIDATLKAHSGTELRKSAEVTTATASTVTGTPIVDLAGGITGISGTNSALTLAFTPAN